MTMNLRLEKIIPSFALFFVVGCGARSPLDVLDNESATSTGGIGGNLGKGGTSGPFGSGGRPGSGGAAGSLARGGSPTAGGNPYSSGGYSYFSAGGYYYTGGFSYYSTGGYYYSTGGSLARGGSPITGGRIVTGGSNSGGSGGRDSSPNGGTQSSGGIPNAGGSAGGSAGSKVDGGFGGSGGTTVVDAYVSRDLLNDRLGDVIPIGDAVKLDGAAPDAIPCPGLASNEELIDDLNDGDRFIPRVNGRVGAWTDYHDASPNGKMFPDPNTGFVPTDTGDVCRKFAAYVAGTGYVLTGSGFWFGLGSPYDASKYTGISFWAKIDAGTSPGVRVAFPDKDTQPEGNICQPGTCYDHYGYRVTLTTTWTKYTVPFSLLKQGGWGHAGTAFDPSTLYQVAFDIDVNATFGIWVDDVAFTM
jgi:hypothetical protein